MTTTSSILVAGMGPVGMTAALMLAKQGLHITVLEAGDDLATESRASTFHPSSLEILDGLGVVDELMATGLTSPGFQYRGKGRELIAHLDMSLLSDETRFPFRVQSEQSNLTRIIRGHLEKMPNVTLRFGAPVDRVEQGTDCAYVYLPGDGFEPSYRVDWLIAADGSNSAVRRSMGIAFEGVTYPERFLVASTTHDFAEDFADLSAVSYVYDPEDWGVLLSTPKHWRVLFPIDPSESSADALAPERVQQRLQGVVALDAPYPLLHSTIYAVHQRLASTFARGRVLLAGDAAHINNPLGGMGMNSGLHDAEAAVDTVLYALAGGDPVRAAETYAKVRRDAAAIDVQQNTQKNYEEMSDRDERSREGRREQMVAIASDPVRARAYLRKTSMLASRQLSRQRIARSFTPVRPALPAYDGTALSDLIREGRILTSDDVGFRAADTAAPLEELAALALRAARPSMVVSTTAPDAATSVALLDQVGLAALEIGVDATRAGLDEVRTAAEARRDALIMATLEASADVTALTELAVAAGDAGADIVALTAVEDYELVLAVHRAIAHLPLALVDASLPDTVTHDHFSVAGVRLSLTTSPLR